MFFEVMASPDWERTIQRSGQSTAECRSSLMRLRLRCRRILIAVAQSCREIRFFSFSAWGTIPA